MPVRQSLCNVAIIAHVDHGETTLIDAMLWQSGAFSERDTVEKTGEHVMDSGDLEREKGITILARNTAVCCSGPAAKALGLEGGVTVSVIDTSGHANFGDEVEHDLFMIDGIIPMVDTSKGPLPQARFVLRGALRAQLPVVVVVNKVDRPGSRVKEVTSEATDLLLSLGEGLVNDGVETDIDSLLDVSVIYASTKAGVCSLKNPGNDIPPTGNLEPLFETILSRIPGPSYERDAPLQARVASLDASPFLGRLVLLRIHNGVLTKDASLGLARHDGTIANMHVAELLRTEGLERASTESTDPDEIVVVTGIEDITTGEPFIDLEDPRPLPLVTINDPAISMTISINASSLAGRVRGAKVTARQVKDRLNRELIGSVSLGVFPTEHPDAWEVQGQGRLIPAVLVEQIRREDFKLTIGKPQVVTREIEGVRCELMERVAIGIPEEHLDAVTQLMATRKGRMETMSSHGSSWIRLEFIVPTRGLIGFRTHFLTETHGTGIASSVAEGYAPWQGTIEQCLMGSLVADRAGQTIPYTMTNLQERDPFIAEFSSEVYEGQVADGNPRGEDMDVNVCHEKRQTNTRSATANVYESLTPSRKLTLKESLEFTVNDECVEVTPDAIRVRKVVLGVQERFKITARERRVRK